MKITFEGDFEEIKGSLMGLFGSALEESKRYADQANAYAAKADSAARNAMVALDEIKKIKGESQ